MLYVKLLLLLPFFAVIFQIYSYAVTRQREERQSVCRGLGIMLLTVGITSLVTRDYLFVLAGFILMMIGFRLIARGLDRLDKKIYIDRYNGSSHD
jgi:protein-S-isoprenylcysteine O-methyltransferase Ste14